MPTIVNFELKNQGEQQLSLLSSPPRLFWVHLTEIITLCLSSQAALQQMKNDQPEYEAIVEKQPEVSGAQLQYKIGVLIEKWSVVAEKLKQWEKR